MSRIGKKPVDLPKGVDFQVVGSLVTVKGPKGQLQHKFTDQVGFEVRDTALHVMPMNKSDKARALWGLSRSLVKNMVEGVSNGFVEYLDINGIGFKAQADKKILTLTLGFSHEIKFIVPEGIEIKTPKPTELEIHGFDKQLIGQVAAEIRSLRKPEPYKGKGIKYRKEVIRRKEGKKK